MRHDIAAQHASCNFYFFSAPQNIKVFCGKMKSERTRVDYSYTVCGFSVTISPLPTTLLHYYVTQTKKKKLYAPDGGCR